MTQQESKAINIARFIFVVGVLFIHFPISYVAADGINMTVMIHRFIICYLHVSF